MGYNESTKPINYNIKLIVKGTKMDLIEFDEKVGDTINYLLLLEACITQEMKTRSFWDQ